MVLPGIEGIRTDLRVAGERGAIPARVDQGRSGDHYLWLYIDGRYGLNLDPAVNGRGYVIRDIRPLRLRDIDQIIRTGFALQASRWYLYGHPGELPDELRARWDDVTSAWRARQQKADGAVSAELPAWHTEFLDTLESLVDKAREIEMSGTKTDRIFRYRSIEPVAARRRNARSIHKFQLMGESEVSELSVGTRVFVEGHPDMRGVVRDITESLVRVDFERPLNFDDIPRMGSFVASPDTTTFDKQAEAIGILRARQLEEPVPTRCDRRPVVPALPAGRQDRAPGATGCQPAPGLQDGAHRARPRADPRAARHRQDPDDQAGDPPVLDQRESCPGLLLHQSGGGQCAQGSARVAADHPRGQRSDRQVRAPDARRAGTHLAAAHPGPCRSRIAAVRDGRRGDRGGHPTAAPASA